MLGPKMIEQNRLYKEAVNIQPSVNNQTRRYALAGILFGFLFPLLATAIKFMQLQLSPTLANMVFIHRSDNLLWIIDTAPIFLGFFAALAGWRHGALMASNAVLEARERDLKEIQLDLEKRVSARTLELERKTIQLDAAVSIAQQIAELHDVSTLLERLVQLVSERIGYEHVGIYLADEKKSLLFLVAASSDNGKKLVLNGHHSGTDEQNVINQAFHHNRLFTVMDTSKSSILQDENFPTSRSRAVIPLSLRRSVLGVLDIHSARLNAFNQDDLEILTTLSRFATISLENTRLLNETNALIDQLKSTARASALESWQSLTPRQSAAYLYTPAGVRPLVPDEFNATWTGSLDVPLKLHGEGIGMIQLMRGSDSPGWTERERALVGKIAAQVALALDNSRLIDDVQRKAAKDRMIGEISSKISGLINLDNIVETTMRELGRTLPDVEIAIQFQQK